ncbi:glycosyltransferase [Aspergillus lucknowensis]|uniref:Capsule polysaccharide biosynthesis protein n=1 Tax=Aspergillus lucknowensis TaxID=176173 RepID=A0ABR4M2D9_9EURO
MPTAEKQTAITNAEILADLQVYKPVRDSERNVWAFWDKGLSSSPGWNQRNVISWVRRLGPSWTVRVLDLVEGSPSHVSRYIPREMLPDVFWDRKMTGPHVGQHSSDLVRLPLLYLYGGVWLDVGMFLFRGLDDLCWNKLEDPETPYEVAAFKVSMGPEISMLFNGYIAARKGSLCIKYWHDIFHTVWQGATSCEGMNAHPLLRHLPEYEPPSRNGKRPPFMYAQFADYLAQVFCLERLRHLTDPSTGWDGPQFFDEKVLLFDCVTQAYWAQRLTDWNGRKQYELLNLPRSGLETGDEKAKEAEALIQGVLGTSSTMKVSHGLVTAGREYLAEIWDKPENSDADIRPGTFAAYLRDASETFEQTKELVPLKMPVMEKAVLRAGITEASE